jgi:hypothetical protein
MTNNLALIDSGVAGSPRNPLPSWERNRRYRDAAHFDLLTLPDGIALPVGPEALESGCVFAGFHAGGSIAEHIHGACAAAMDGRYQFHDDDG